MIMVHKVMQAAVILQLQAQVRKMEISWGTLANILYIPDARPQNKENAVRISGARILTSDKCVAILKEREEKQKQQ